MQFVVQDKFDDLQSAIETSFKKASNGCFNQAFNEKDYVPESKEINEEEKE